ncbi:hypothetical protein OIDMADRAFT_37983 [Oidiodendron maius Zn]|uniref:Bifunctional cytochrome P450/NADPH--P450 reductase n=1 Tax=Oidiodendron maius (strain Zn) TaxID=913774 RepID=A0A0C3I231_OIDMZ|nr:hypothetical protein OIDMADRAFT_37983 [Oidiodendron maius Zn]
MAVNAWNLLEPIPQPPLKYFGLLGHAPEIDLTFPARSLWRLMDLYGPIYEANLQGRKVFVGTHALLSEMLDEDQWVKIPAAPQQELRAAAGDGLVTAFSHEKNWWKAHRLLTPSFGPLGIRRMFDDMLELSSQLVLKWDRYDPENEIDCVEDFTQLTFDTIGLCAFNFRFNEFYTDEVHPFAKQLGEVLIESGKRTHRPGLVNRLVFFRDEQRRQENIAQIHNLCDKIIRDRLENPKPDATDLLNVLLHGVDKDTREKLPIENVRYQIGTFLSAGYETTASTLSFIYYHLCDNPDKLTRLQREVDEVLGDKVITVDMLPKLVYLDACIKEAMRLNPPVNLFTRNPIEDRILGGKYSIKKEIPVSCLLRHLHRDTKIWGEDAEVFRPERMLNGAFEALPKGAWQPFGDGLRACIGRTFSFQEMHISIAQVLQRFDIRKADSSYKLVMRSNMTTKPANFKIKVSRRPGRGIMFGIPGGTVVDGAQRANRRQDERVDRATNSNGPLKPITVFIGGNSGTCEGLAEDLAGKATDFGLAVDIKDLDEAVASLPTENPSIIITASYEDKPSDNAKKFVAWIEELSRKSAQLPKSTKYALFGGGNSDWTTTFHRIPKLVNDTLFKLGAERLVDADYANVKLDLLGPWEDWSEKLCFSLCDDNSKSLSHASAGVDVCIEHATTWPQAGVENMGVVTLVSNYELADTSAGAAKRHVDILLPAGTEYIPGDYLFVQGRNPDDAVRRVMARFKLGQHDMLSVKSSKKTFLPVEPMAVDHFLATRVELVAPVTRRQIATLKNSAKQGSAEYRQLEKLYGEEQYNEILLKRYSVLDVLEEVPGLDLPFGFPALSGHGTFRGVVSSYLATCKPGDRLHCSVRPNKLGFRLPENPEIPVIMVAAGTGIAPLRAFIAERAAIKRAASGRRLGPAVLYFGCRNVNKDYLYRNELEQWQKTGVVDVIPCFSRPDGGVGGRHVDAAMWEDRGRLWGLFQKGGNIYVCGSASRLGRSSAQVFKRIWMDKTGKSEVDADDWLDEIKSSRYVTDVY